ncbi:1527_t:CDS:10 [Diversispora eburnea]|uniref:1527_t:CDS:1 n=1 Tax=Diversispora eburnea TaxID=1213867 RepID=A0A9N9G4A0_9GLOM|nr:1527_t:CDS:10 [Diversispora eburnea]
METIKLVKFKPVLKTPYEIFNIITLRRKHAGKSEEGDNRSPVHIPPSFMSSDIILVDNTLLKSSSSSKNPSLFPQQLEYSKKKPSTTITSSSYSSIILGFPDDNYISLKEDNDPYATKIGGIPNWLIESCPASYDFMICKNCGKEMFLLFQGYVPLENSIYDRVIYVWGCNQQKCMKKHSGSKIHSQISLTSGFNLGEKLFLSTSNSLTVDNNELGVELFRNEEDNTSLSSEKVEDVIATAIPKTWKLCADINSKLSLQSWTGNGDWVGEEYEKPSLPKGIDKAFMKFMKRVNEFPNQCIRYEFNGQPLLYNQNCELEVLGTNNVSYYEELVLVQYEE